MLEKDIEKKVCNYAEKKGWWVAKFSSPNNRGVPDRIFLKNGKVIFIEFKSSKGKLTKLQQHKIDEIAHYKGTVHVVNNIEQGCELFNG